MALNAAERKLRSQLAAHTSWANTKDRKERTDAGRRAAFDRFMNEVDPERVLPPDERTRRAQSLEKAHMARLSLASAKARDGRKTSARPGARATARLRRTRSLRTGSTTRSGDCGAPPANVSGLETVRRRHA
jgi:hypothetical protein